MDVNVFEVLESRGYIYQCTNFDQIKALLAEGKPVTFYLGIDPTADSLHIGHFFALMMFRYLQDAGHRGIVVVGGATALIGDPSGKSDMRKMLTKEQVQANMKEVTELVKRFVRLDGENPALVLNNADWINPQSYVDFMRNIGIHFNVNTMLQADAYANRLKTGGLTFLEMGYMLMQAYDFVYLNQEYQCAVQIGGSDQWGNIVAGTSLYRKMKFQENSAEDAEDIVGLTCPLLLTKDGKKMGKTEQGTLWVARDKTTPYDFYQYFYNVDDENVEMLLKLFTRLELSEIASLCSSDILAAKRAMAYEITALVHGTEEAGKVLEAARALFDGAGDSANIPSVTLTDDDFMDGAIDIVSALVKSGLAKSRGEARRLVDQGGVLVDDAKAEGIGFAIAKEQLPVLLKKGKKGYCRLTTGAE